MLYFLSDDLLPQIQTDGLAYSVKKSVLCSDYDDCKSRCEEDAGWRMVAVKFKEQLAVLASLEEVFFVDMVKRDDESVVIAGTTYLNETDLADRVVFWGEHGGYYRYNRIIGRIHETEYKLGSWDKPQHPVCQANPFSVIW